MKNLFFSIGLCFFLVGCAKQNSSMVNQSGIFTSYFLSYDAGNQSLAAIASFNFGGSTGTYLVLDGGSYVEFDNEVMGQDITFISQVFYQWKKSSLSPSMIWNPHTFKYRNNDGNFFTNSVTLPLLPTVSYSTLSILPGQSLGVQWSISDSLNKGSINVFVTDGERNVLSSISGNNTSSGNIQISSTELTKLNKGTVSAYVCRTQLATISEAPQQGGLVQSSSCTAKQSLVLN